jgi:hypothetical protein
MCESSSVSPSVSPSRSFDRRLLYRDVVFVRMLLIKDDIVLSQRAPTGAVVPAMCVYSSAVQRQCCWR